MDKREQTRAVARTVSLVERHLATLAELAEITPATASVDDVDAAAEYAANGAELAVRIATEMAAGGTPTCQRHLARVTEARDRAVELAATVRRAMDVERARRADVTHDRRTMLERDYPALAAVVACAPDDTYFLESAVALVRADDCREVMDAMRRFRPSLGWDEVTMPPPAALAEFITSDTDARELAGVIAAYADAAEPLLPGILAESEAAGWLMPEEAYPDESVADSLVDGYAHPVHGGGDDMDVAEAATLAVARYGIFDDDHRPDDSAIEWWAWVVPGVPVWLPHVEAWREDVDYDTDTLTMRQMDRDCADWEDWGRDDYLCAYAEAYAEAILDAETPPTVGEDEDSGIHPEDRAEQARERAQAVVDELDVGLSDVRLEESPLDPDEIAACARDDAQTAYREAARAAAVPAGMAPLF